MVGFAVPHGSACAGALLPLKKHFFLLQCRDFLLHETVYIHSYLTDFPECYRISEWIFKEAFKAILLAPAMHNRVSAIPTGFLVYLLKEAQMFCPNMTSL